jgi:hypothetical protein
MWNTGWRERLPRSLRGLRRRRTIGPRLLRILLIFPYVLNTRHVWQHPWMQLSCIIGTIERRSRLMEGSPILVDIWIALRDGTRGRLQHGRVAHRSWWQRCPRLLYTWRASIPRIILFFACWSLWTETHWPWTWCWRQLLERASNIVAFLGPGPLALRIRRIRLRPMLSRGGVGDGGVRPAMIALVHRQTLRGTVRRVRRDSLHPSARGQRRQARPAQTCSSSLLNMEPVSDISWSLGYPQLFSAILPTRRFQTRWRGFLSCWCQSVPPPAAAASITSCYSHATG